MKDTKKMYSEIYVSFVVKFIAEGYLMTVLSMISWPSWRRNPHHTSASIRANIPQQCLQLLAHLLVSGFVPLPCRAWKRKEHEVSCREKETQINDFTTAICINNTHNVSDLLFVCNQRSVNTCICQICKCEGVCDTSTGHFLQETKNPIPVTF